MSHLESLKIAEVPVLLRPPADPSLPAPLILLWHGFGIPNSEETLAEVLPLPDLQAWKAYLGLPFFGNRLPVGGLDEIMRRQMEDYVFQLLLPTLDQAMQELPTVVQELQARCKISTRSDIGLFGFSAGGAAALLTLVESPVTIAVAVLAGVTKDLVSAIATYERSVKQHFSVLKAQFPWLEERHQLYQWSAALDAAQQRLDFVARAPEIAQRQRPPAILFVHGLNDQTYPVSEVETLYAALNRYYKQANQSERLALRVFEHLGHQLDLAAAKQSPDLQQDINDFQQTIADWFSQHLRA